MLELKDKVIEEIAQELHNKKLCLAFDHYVSLSSLSLSELKDLLWSLKNKKQSVTVTNAKKQLLIQQIENKLETNGLTLRAGKNATLDKMTIPQLKAFMTSLDKHLTKLGK